MKKSKMGQPRKYEPEELVGKANEYLSTLVFEENGQTKFDFAMIIDFMQFLKVNHSWWYELGKDYSGIKKKVEMMFESWNVRAMNRGIPTSWGIFYFKNKHGYTDKQEVQSTNFNMNADVEMTDDQLKEIMGE